ncbi:hypothetical protein O0880_14555 [Janthinobacterium sp. SUN118]|nr:hypothetical protein [Janthinobacterium sp. SUN118]MDN2710643.1 hypothetical protein [Janthinobacterium sp. SUN118]
MIRLIPIFPPRPAGAFVHIPLLELHQLPPGVPFDECLKQLKEPA